jgi:dTDP-4-dehydrorhamnose reductase
MTREDDLARHPKPESRPCLATILFPAQLKEIPLRALVLGAGGQLGAELVSELKSRNHTVFGFGRQELDITDPEAIAHAFAAYSPDCVINSAAYNMVDIAEREPAVAMNINGLAVRSLALACRKAEAVFMHFSTDHVFDGTKTEPYTEDDLPSPPSAYAISKLTGELFARAYCEKSYVVRVAGVFGPAGRFTNRGNFPELVLKKAAEGSPLRVVEDFFASPTYAPALASRCLDLLERTPPGLYHLGGGTTISWYEYGLKILAAAGLTADIQPTNHREFLTPARRPMHAGLSNAKAEKLGIAPMPPLEEALKEYMGIRNRMPEPDDTGA